MPTVLDSKGIVHAFPEGVTPEQIAEAMREYERRAGLDTQAREGFQEGVSALIGLPHLAGRGLQDIGFRREVQDAGKFIERHTYSPEEVYSGISTVTGQERTEAKTPMERVVRAGAAGAAGGLVGGGIGGAPGGVTSAVVGGGTGAVGGAVSGAAAQGAAELGAPSWVQILAAFGVPISAGTTLAALKNALASTPQKIMKDALRNATAEQMRAAQRLMDAAREQGTPLTVGEAVAGVTGGANNRLLDIQRYVEQSRGAGPQMSEFMSRRPAQNRAAFGEQMDAMSPGPVTGQQRTDVPQNLQQAAEAAVSREVADMRGRTGPLYTAAAGDLVPEDAMRQIIGRIDRQISVSTGRVQDQLLEFRNGLIDVPAAAESRPAMQAITGAPTRVAASEIPVMDIARLDNITKAWRDRLELPVVSASAIDKEAAAKLGPILGDLRTEMRRASPQFEAGAAEHGRSMDEVIEPMQRSPLGPLAETRQGPTTTADELLAHQRNVLTPLDPKTTDPEMIRTVARQLQIEDPTSLELWQRVNLESVFDAATKQMQTVGAGEWGGARFALAVSANERQAANLHALLESLPNGPQVAEGFDGFLQVLRAQGYRQKPGSMTAWNQQLARDVEAGRIPLGLVRPIKEFQEKWLDRRREKNARALAEMLLDPQGAEAMANLRGFRANTTAGRYAFALVAAEYVRQAQMLEAQDNRDRPQ